MNDLTNVTSQAKLTALPESWVEKLFQRMEDRYGSLWSDRYGQFPRERVKNSWAEDLAGFTGEEMKRGLDACKQIKFPPTLPEFLMLCRPPINPEAAFHEAVKQLMLRQDGKDTWSHEAIYWAAQSIGGADMNLPWQSIKARWTKELNDMLDEPTLPDIPAFALALPPPGKTSTSSEDVHKHIEMAARLIQEPSDYKAWAKRIIEMEKMGGKPNPVALQMASEAINNT